MRFIPFFHGLYWSFTLEGRLRQLLIIQTGITYQSLFQIFSAIESMCFEYISNTSVETFDHSIGLRST
ncbi:hypothetical protein SAMN05216317_1076 [Nitrosomonas eutropha]|uniref:Uncharacterized protein n=1 Tax=Nitrosomonas eutropha TaxID=916 RepID=A0ABX5M9B2_9PROT|nr:hypothetical protein C8R14_10310 [Nitrosomonas eutropha]SDW51929.1 hypothetical protein SAMN05216317_1076 [Nitrosomonas eutropha]SEI53460.1 hypothetical protein SAMN05216318_10510 [Nitrosomonas eutropha]